MGKLGCISAVFVVLILNYCFHKWFAVDDWGE